MDGADLGSVPGVVNPMDTGQQKILLLDDEQALLDVYSCLLQQLPSRPEVHCATSGARALALLESGEFALLVLDLRMPRMDGLQVLSIVRRKYPALRTAILTGVREDHLRSRAYSLGVDLYLEKPGSPKEVEFLLDCVESLLGEELNPGFRGLQSKALVDLVQMECISQGTSVLRISHGTTEGKIWIQNGEVVDAEVLDLVGESAFRRIMSWKIGGFEVMPGEPERPRTILKSGQCLLLETAQAFDEAQAPDGGGIEGITPIAELGRLPNVEFVVAVDAETGHYQSWGLDSTESAAGFTRDTGRRMQQLADMCGWGNWESLAAKGHVSHVGLVPHSEHVTMSAGFKRSTTLDQVHATMKLISAKWTS